MVTTLQQRERLVLNLYNQGKNTPEIAEEARMSFSSIGAILKKAEEEKEARTKAVSILPGLLFSEGKTPLQVAIALNLRNVQVIELYKRNTFIYSN
jgi:DNA-binding CsgD family transcriptional regulator